MDRPSIAKNMNQNKSALNMNDEYMFGSRMDGQFKSIKSNAAKE